MPRVHGNKYKTNLQRNQGEFSASVIVDTMRKHKGIKRMLDLIALSGLSGNTIRKAERNHDFVRDAMRPIRDNNGAKSYQNVRGKT